jgi:DNA repair protein RadC
MTPPVTTILPADRPRERLWALGPAALTTAELVAILIGTGDASSSVLEVSGRLLEVGEGSLRRLATRPRGELLQTSGIGPAKAARLLAAFELGARLAREERPPVLRIREPDDVARLFRGRLRDLQVEEFRAAIAEAAAGIIVVHNHPSGDPTPSAEDRAVTQQLAAAGRLLDLPLYDHVIIAGDRFVSFACAGLL